MKRIGDLLFGAASRNFVLLAMILGYLFFLLILNRWFVTPLGLRSFGRVWQFYANYQDFGFGRRAFLGTILSLTKANQLIQNEYIFAHVFTAITGLLISLSLFVLLRDAKLQRAAIIGIALSPSLLSHFAYTGDNFDALTFLLALLAAFCASNIYALCAVSVVGMLTHEMFLFYLPTVLVLFWIARGRHLEGRARFELAYPIAAAFVAYLSLKLFAAPPLAQAKYEAIVASRLPLAAHQNNFWSGYFERYSNVADNYVAAKAMIAQIVDPKNFAFEAIPLSYLLLVAVIAVRGVGGGGFATRCLYAIAIAFPLLIAPLATDFYRWVCMSANAGLLIIAQSARNGDFRMTNSGAGALLAFSVLAPFGGDPLARPCPLHQFIAEKLFPR